MPDDLSTIARDFPTQPDWTWLQEHWPGSVLLHMDASLADVELRARGQFAYLATPHFDWVGGPEDASDWAVQWVRQLTASGIASVAHVVTAQMMNRAGQAMPDPLSILRRAELVVVPPMAGWDGSGEIWRAVCAALDANIPVYVLADQARAV